MPLGVAKTKPNIPGKDWHDSAAVKVTALDVVDFHSISLVPVRSDPGT